MEDVIVCDCGDAEHQFLIRSMEEEHPGYPKEVYLTIHLVKRSFWYRVKYGLKYIFGYKCRYGAWDEIIISRNHVPKLDKIIKYLES